ncbi:MAG: universal stress protein [Planctomycetia bacterium]|nr:universal stress protein [Planctomycetia bacterium]
MATQKILVPCDFSKSGRAAFEYATKLARETGTPLIIVHVQELPMVYGEGAYYYGVPEPDASEIRKMLHDVQPMDRDVVFEHRLLDGDPAAQIAALAKAEGIDLIVMSSHGRTGLGRMLLGSVAEAVIRRADCPVLIVKPTANAEPLHAGVRVAEESIAERS